MLDFPDDDLLTTEDIISFIKRVYDSCQTEEDLGYAEGYINLVLMDVRHDQVDEVIDTIAMSEEFARMRILFDDVISVH